jgi:hypothetical protein
MAAALEADAKAGQLARSGEINAGAPRAAGAVEVFAFGMALYGP